MRIEADTFVLRPWLGDDIDALVRHADNPRVARYMGDVFPNPYTRSDAECWISRCINDDLLRAFAIEFEGEAIGGIGFIEREGVYSRTRSIGYWLGEPFWGRGIATRATKAFIPYCFEESHIIRLEAYTFGWNTASGRVLEKAGFILEGREKDAICKHGEITDRVNYRLLRSEWKR